MHYDRQGNKIEDVLEWSMMLGDESYKKVGDEHLANGLHVSTIWLGLDHGYKRHKPLIFETMAFNGSDMMGILQERYYTEAEAIEGHNEIVAQYSCVTRWQLFLISLKQGDVTYEFKKWFQRVRFKFNEMVGRA